MGSPLAPRAVVLAAALALSSVLAGCLMPVPQDAPGAVAEGHYRFIEVEGNWTASGPPRTGVCGYPSTPEVDAANRTVRFHNDWPGNDFAVLFLTVTWDRSGCGTAATSWWTSHRWDGVQEEVDGGEGFAFEMRDDGALLVNGTEVPRGGEARFAQRGTLPDGRAYHHEIVVRDHGEWPLDGVSLAPS